MKHASFTAVLRKNAAWKFESCEISPDKIFILKVYAYFLLKFLDNLDFFANKITWKIGDNIYRFPSEFV